MLLVCVFILRVFILADLLNAQPLPELLSSLTPPFGSFTPTQPVALAVSPEDQLYLLDAQQAVVVRLSLSGDLLDQFGGPGSGSEQLSEPSDLNISLGLDLFLADGGNDRLVRMNRRLVFLAEFRSNSSAPENLALERPLSVIQGLRGDLFVADGGNDRILKIAASGEPIFAFGAYGEARGSLWQPRRLELDPGGGLWVLDQRGQVVHFDEFGGFLEEQKAELTGRPTGLAVAAETIWVSSDSALWCWDRTARQTDRFSLAQIGLPFDHLIVDLAFRPGQLWVLDDQGIIYRFRI